MAENKGSENKGTVKWFNDAKGFGFIQHESGKDVFVHFSVIESDGFKTLKDGEEVLYEFVEGPKGLQATHVRRTQVTQIADAGAATPSESDESESTEEEISELQEN